MKATKLTPSTVSGKDKLVTLQDIMREAEALPMTERRELIKLLVDTLAVSDAKESEDKRHSLRELRGLGKEIWQEIDAQEYINQQRDEWDQ